MGTKLTEQQQKTLFQLQRQTMELQSQRAALKGQQASLTSDHTSAETTLRYLQEQKEDAVVYYAVGRIFVKHSMKEAREGHLDGVKQLSAELESIEKALGALEKQASSAQSNLVDFLKSNNIPYQLR